MASPSPLVQDQAPSATSSLSTASSSKSSRRSSSDAAGAASPSPDTLKAVRARLKEHKVPAVEPSQLSLRQRLSEGAFGTVYVADARGLPDYGKNESEDDGVKLVAVKFLADSATDEER